MPGRARPGASADGNDQPRSTIAWVVPAHSGCDRNGEVSVVRIARAGRAARQGDSTPVGGPRFRS